MKTSRFKYYAVYFVIDIFMSFYALCVPAIVFFVERVWELEKIPLNFWKALGLSLGAIVYFQVFFIGICYKHIGTTIIEKKKIVYISPFGKKWCEVDMSHPVYYAFCYPYYTAGRKFLKVIAVSNESFVLPVQGKLSLNYYLKNFFRNKEEFYLCYDKNKVIVLDFDERTKPLLPVENWLKVGEQRGRIL